MRHSRLFRGAVFCALIGCSSTPGGDLESDDPIGDSTDDPTDNETPQNDAGAEPQDPKADAEPDPEDATTDEDATADEDATTDEDATADEDATTETPEESEVPLAPDWAWVAAVPLEWMVTTLAGSGTSGFADGTKATAVFSDPKDVAVDGSGNVYVADSSNHRIRKVSPAGDVTTLAGSGLAGFADGASAAAKFDTPSGVAVDGKGNVYVGDFSNHRIRKISPTGDVTTLAGSGTKGFANGTSAKAKFDSPYGVTVDGSGNVYVADSGNNRIRKVDSAGNVTTFAGAGAAGFADGTNTKAKFNDPYGVIVDGSGNVYVADSSNHRMRRVEPAGNVTTLAGSGIAGFADGTSATAMFNSPSGVAVDANGNRFMGDSGNNRLRRVSLAGIVTTLAGSGAKGFADGKATSAQFNHLGGLAIDASGNLYVADTANHRIRKVELSGVGKLTVSWNASSAPNGPPILGYTASASANGQTTRTCTTTSETTCVISGLTSGIPYAVSVVAKNAVGNSPPSNAVVGTPN